MPKSPSPPSYTGSDARASSADDLARGFGEVCKTHFDFVWRFAANGGIPPSALDRVVQDVFAVVRRRCSSESRSMLRAGIAGAARNVVRSYPRKRENQLTFEPFGNELRPFEATGLSESLDRMSAAELLDSILAWMSDSQREVFILCEVEGVSPAEAAYALGLNENTLRTRLQDAGKVFNTVSARLRAQRFWAMRSSGSKPSSAFRSQGRELITLALEERTPSESDRQRVLTALMERAAADSRPSRLWTLLVRSKWAVLVGLLGSVAAFGYARRHASSPTAGPATLKREHVESRLGSRFDVERATREVLALCRLGRKADARKLASALRASPAASRAIIGLKGSCAE